MKDSVLMAAGLGGVTGMRSFQGLAWLSREYTDRRVPLRATALRRWLADDTVSVVLSGLALGELVADKVPGVPARIQPGPLMGRAAIGGLVGALVVGRKDRALGAAVGAGAAIVASFGGWLLRTEGARQTGLPDVVLALAEDAGAVVAARSLARNA